MGTIFLIIMILGIISYLGLIIMEPEKHIVSLIIIAIIYAIFGSFFDSTGAKADYDKRKRG